MASASSAADTASQRNSRQYGAALQVEQCDCTPAAARRILHMPLPAPSLLSHLHNTHAAVKS